MDRREFDPAIMSLRGRIGAHVLHARHDPRETTRAAREAFRATFLVDVDPEGLLPEPERQRRAEHLRRAHFARLALASAQARSKGRDQKNGTAPVDETRAAAVGEVHDDAGVAPTSTT